ncbi:iron ABC transporter permease [Thermococcus chitonophagus]|uniref:Iron (Iii) abc transporter, atp-binding protein n=1 Tax=Thermococcus chitonophagus TaxID=54262 RepID=A0A160VSI5_9EURY|nr:ABC transporter ATP-binding protein [Thermococcus chitonophagus]ASJ17350.1 iron ABC transporter permease [Thermococcus chitonophagus]CUX77985.1 iron (iii) abc transporter, atp-binding protein [Thermococcus chitonophagus]
MPDLNVHISFSYGKRKILDNVSFTAKKGKLLAIIGPNGSGKSTLLKCIAGILRPEGEIKYGDINLIGLRPKERAKIVSYVPQSSFPEFAFTVEEFVELGTYASGGDVEEALRSVGLLEKKNELITNLSGGEYQLALIARALAQGSDVMLLDEPTSHLDINHAKEVVDLLLKLKEEKVIVAVLHDLNIALNYADEILVLKYGRVLWRGTPEDISEKVIWESYNVVPKVIRANGMKAVIP